MPAIIHNDVVGYRGVIVDPAPACILSSGTGHDDSTPTVLKHGVVADSNIVRGMEHVNTPGLVTINQIVLDYRTCTLDVNSVRQLPVVGLQVIADIVNHIAQNLNINRGLRIGVNTSATLAGSSHTVHQVAEDSSSRRVHLNALSACCIGDVEPDDVDVRSAL